MKLEEAKEYLEQFIGRKKEYKYKPIKIKTMINTRQAIETVLQELDNFIPKDKTKEKLNTVKNRMDYLRKEINKTLNEEAGTETEIDINEQYIERLEIELERLETTKRILEELLEDK